MNAITKLHQTILGGAAVALCLLAVPNGAEAHDDHDDRRYEHRDRRYDDPDHRRYHRGHRDLYPSVYFMIRWEAEQQRLREAELRREREEREERERARLRRVIRRDRRW